MNKTTRYIKRVLRLYPSSTQGVAKLYPRCSQALSRLMSMLRVCLQYAYSMARSSLGAGKELLGSWLKINILFPHWGKNIPILGKKYSQSGNKTGIQFVVTLLLLMVVGVNMSWGQTGTSRSGVFYFVNGGSGKTKPNDPKIADITDPDEYFYLVPADDPKQGNKRDAWYSSNYSSANGDSEKPYLTTYKTKKDAADIPTGVTNRSHNSVWIVSFASTDLGTDYYNLIHAATGKYVVYEPPYSAYNNRKSVHLLTTDSPGENAKFAITTNSNNYNFRPKSAGTGNDDNKYLNPSNRNFNYYYSHSSTSDGDANYYEGLIGLWKEKGGASDWKPDATLLTAPATSVNNNRVTVTDNNGLPEGYNIRYTFGDGSQADPDASSEIMATDGYHVTQEGTLKVVVERYGVVLTEVAEKEVSPVPCATPVISFDYITSTVSITCATTGATIYYTTDGNDPTASGTEYQEPFFIAATTTVKAIATRTDFPNSEVATQIIKLVQPPTITYNTSNLIEMATDVEGGSIYYTTDGTTPSVINGRRYQTPFDPADEVTTIKAITIDKDGETSNVATFIPPVLLGSNHIRLIQNQGNAWTCEEHKGGHFYMLPAANGENLHTTSLFLPEMQWHFLNAGVGDDGYQYYYIIQGEKRLRSDGVSVQLKTFESESANQFKFRLVPYPMADAPTDFNIVPYGLTDGNMYVNKTNGNATDDIVALGSSNSDGTARWKFILPSAFDKTPPFTASNDNQSYFYQISSGEEYIIQSTETAVATSTSTDAEAVKTGSWMLMLVPDTEIPVGDNFTYYYIRNAKTNAYLYYNGGDAPGFAISADLTANEADKDKYRFCWARSTTTDGYYLIPRTQVSTAKASLTGLSVYTITAAPGFVLDPVLAMDEEGMVTMTCATNASEIFYRIDGDYNEADENSLTIATNPVVPVESGKRPVLPTRLYSTEFLLSLDASQVRAVAVLKNERSVQSAVKIINLAQCGTPAPTDESFHDAQGSLTIPKVKVKDATGDKPAVYADIYYTLDNTSPALVETTPHDEQPEIIFQYNSRSKIYAVATKHGMRKSEPYQQEVVYMPTITLEQESYTYSAVIEGSTIVSQAIEPTITKVQVDGETTPIPSTDYVVKGYGDNTEAGTGKIIIKATPEATIKLYGVGNFVINKAPLKSVTVTSTSFTYNHRAQGPEITSIKAACGNGDIELLNFDAYYTVIGNVQVSAGSHTLRVEAKEGTNFTGYIETPFTIGSKSLTADDISITVKKELKENTTDEYIYVPTVKDGSVTLKEGKDYTTTDPVATTDGCTLTLIGKDNYKDTREFAFVDLSFERPENSNADYAAPYVASADLATPLGMTAYIVTGTKGNKVILEELAYIPEDVPVLMLTGKRADGFGKVTKTGDTYSTEELTEINTKNKLKKATGTDAERTLAAALVYLFYKGEFVLNAVGTLPAGKVYLDLRDTSTPTPAPYLIIDSSQMTNIDEMKRTPIEQVNERWYTLDGRLLSGKPTQKGLFIKNGCKVVIK